jgi:hypothetical protein
MQMKKLLTSILGVASLLVLVPSMRAQATYTAERTSRIQAGGGLLYLNNDYNNNRTIYGASFWGDFDFSRHIGIEAEGHLGSFITPDDVNQTSYLIGPRFSYRRRRLNVFGKIMLGKGTLSTVRPTLRNTSTTYNIVPAYGGGLEYQYSRRLNIRVVDVEMQKWPDFEPHTLSPLAISVGFMYVIR